MTLGINSNRARDLAYLLKTKTVSAKAVRVGDLMVDDHSVIEVVGREFKDGYLVLKEVDGNHKIFPAQWDPKLGIHVT